MSARDRHGKARGGAAMAALAGVLAFGLSGNASAEARCSTALAIGIDVSGSVDAREMALQSEGLARALVARDVAAAFLAPGGVTRLAVYDWNGVGSARIVLDWTEIRSEADLARAAGAVRAPRAPGGRTALGYAIAAGVRLLATQGDCRKLILDLTGDGFSNDGLPPDRLDMAAAAGPSVAAGRAGGVVVNALVIAERRGSGEEPSLARLSAYFEESVIRGPGAFVEPAEGFENFEAAMERKLLRELGGAQFSGQPTRLRLAEAGIGR